MLHGLSFRVRLSPGWRSCTFSLLPDFVVKTQNPSVPDSCFKEFLVPSLDDFVSGDQDELLLCPSEPFVSTYPGRSGIVLVLKVRSSRLVGFNNGCPVAPFHFSSAQFLPWLRHPLRKRIVGLWGLVLTRSGSMRCLYYLRGTVQSFRCWRQELGQPSLPSPPSAWEMSPTGTWIHSPLGLWWRLSRSCNPPILLALV